MATTSRLLKIIGLFCHMNAEVIEWAHAARTITHTHTHTHTYTHTTVTCTPIPMSMTISSIILVCDAVCVAVRVAVCVAVCVAAIDINDKIFDNPSS